MPTAEECCSRFFPGRHCKTRKSSCSIPDAPAPTPGEPPGSSCDNSYGWHVVSCFDAMNIYWIDCP